MKKQNLDGIYSEGKRVFHANKKAVKASFKLMSRTPWAVIAVINKGRQMYHADLQRAGITGRVSLDDFLLVKRANGFERFLTWEKCALPKDTIIRYSKDPLRGETNIFGIRLGTARDKKGRLVYAAEFAGGKKYALKPCRYGNVPDMLSSLVSKKELSKTVTKAIKFIAKNSTLEDGCNKPAKRQRVKFVSVPSSAAVAIA